MIVVMMLVIIIKKITFMTIYCVPGTVPSTAHELTRLIFTTSYKVGSYCAHFIDTNTEAQRG